MAVNRFTFSNDLRAKELNYTDEFFKLKSEKVIPSDSFSFDTYEAFKDINDFKTNNYSNLFLINKQNNSNWLEAQVKKQDKKIGLATTLSWFTDSDGDSQEKGTWLYFAKNYEMFDINVSTVDCLLTYGKTEGNYSNYIFYLEFLDQNTCRISHTFGDLIFYLVVQDDKTIQFSKNIDGQKQVFIYSLDGNLLKLYKKVQHKKFDIRDEVIGTYERLYILEVGRNQETEKYNLRLSEDITKQDYTTMIFVHENSLMYYFYLDGSWVGYDNTETVSRIDRDRSAFELKTQALLHHEYNKDQGINFIPLKNNLTYKGNSIRGNNTNQSTSNYPDVDYRTYTSIQSGTNQEKGFDNIILTFTFVDQEYEIEEGDDLLFTIPQKSLEETNMLEPLWPYKYINLNDTKFIKNGSFGSNVPFFSDKVKKLQNHNSIIVDSLGNKVSPNNQTYLCSWLYKANHQAQPMWLDRYYYPDMISRADALKGQGFEISFENMIDMNYNEQSVKKAIHQKTYFDKKSDLMIEPGNTYRYQRISNDTVNQILEELSDYKINTVTNEAKKNIYLNEYFQFNNESFRKINYNDLRKTNKLNLNADFYLQRDKRIGIQLFGTDYNNGFNIQNRKDLVPFHYIATDDVLYMVNNKNEIVHRFDLGQKYNDLIMKIILGDVFDDVIIVTGMYMYILTYDLMLRNRIDLTATQDERQSIKNLEKIAIFEHGTEYQLINYPYGHVGKWFNSIPVTSGQVEMEQTETQNSKPFTEHLIAINSRLIDYKTVESGFVKIPSNLGQMLSNYNPILYKNNIYIPIKQDIMKIIMCPDCERDFVAFPESDREKFSACARILESDEYYLNYNKTNNSANDKEKMTVEQGFIEVENLVKHIHVDKHGTIYGLNFDQYAVAGDDDTIYGLYAWQKYLDCGGWWWLFNQSLSKMKSEVSSSKYAEFTSPNSIDKVKFNELGEMCLIRNFNNIADNNNDDNNKRMDIYDKTKKRIYTFDLSGYDKVLTLDAYNFINEAHEEQTCFSIICSAYGGLYNIRYLSNSNSITINKIEGVQNLCKEMVETINTNALMRYNDYNVLYFNLHIPSNYTYDYIATIKWNLEGIQSGWYNINVNVDLDKAQFEVRVNDEIKEVINETTHSWFKPYQSSNGNIFSTNYYIGTLGKKYGTTLNKMLKNSAYDPYVCKNCIIDRMKIYTKTLDYYEYLAMRMEESKVNKLILTLPCGNRNGVDEMIRYFKYNAAPAISNKVKINISGTGLSTTGEFDMLRKEIMSVLENNIDCMTNIKEINFIQD